GPLQAAGWRALYKADVVVIKIEAAGDIRVATEQVRADRAARRIAACMQPGGDRRRRVCEAITRVVAYAVLRGQEPGHDRGVRRECEWDIREGVIEDDRVVRELADDRRGVAVVAVGREMV